jgi:hypothetical protein
MSVVKCWLPRAVCPAAVLAVLAVLVACCLVLCFARGPERGPLPGPYEGDAPELRRERELDEQRTAALNRVNERRRLALEVTARAAGAAAGGGVLP